MQRFTFTRRESDQCWCILDNGPANVMLVLDTTWDDDKHAQHYAHELCMFLNDSLAAAAGGLIAPSSLPADGEQG